MSLVCKPFKLNESISFKCYIFVIKNYCGGEKFWFKARDIVNFLEYKNVRVDNSWLRTWSDLKGYGLANTPLDWKPETAFISEPGFYSIVSRSKKPEAIAFTKWIYDTVLPSLRTTLPRQYMSRYRDSDQLARVKLDNLKGFIYVATTDLYKLRNIYKIGFTSDLTQRLCSLNTARTIGDDFYFVDHWPTNDCRATEQHIFDDLADCRSHKDFFIFDNCFAATANIENVLLKK